MEYKDVKIFGIDIANLYDYNLDHAYELLKEKSDFVNNIEKSEVKEIKFSYYKEIIILLKDGSLYIDGNKLFDDIEKISFLSGISIYAISKNRVIYPLEKDEICGEFINNNDYKYKKIVIDVLKIVALTNDRTIKVIGTLIDEPIDYKKYMDVDDIGYDEKNKRFVIIKDNKIISLFSSHSYNFNDKNIKLTGQNRDYMIL